MTAERNALTEHARYLGADAALAAASWQIMSEADARSILDDVDPMVLDRYAEPTLGQWEEACNETLGMMLDLPRWDDAIGTAWEQGCDEVWHKALQGVALRTLGIVGTAVRVERELEVTVAGMRTMAGLS